MLRNYHEVQRSRIENDLTSFADPGGVHISDDRKRSFFAEWMMRGEPREARFTVSPERGVTVRANGTTRPYTVFLADTRMADLRQVAQMIQQASRREIFVPTRARRTDRDTGNARTATALLTELLEQPEADATQIVMVTGDAGAGKTRVLRKPFLRKQFSPDEIMSGASRASNPDPRIVRFWDSLESVDAQASRENDLGTPEEARQ